MSFNPSLPVNGSQIRAGELRGQFNGLKELIDNSSGGQPGPPGPAGADGRGIAAVNDSGDGRCVIVLTDGSSAGPFTVASGPQGIQGERGSDGSPGPMGGDGPAGPAGSDGVSIASVYDAGDGRCMVQLSNGQTSGPFTVAMGPQGGQGAPGEPGPAGPPGEVTTQQLNDTVATAIAGTPRNVDSFSQLNITISDPPTQSEVQQLLDSYNALILALRRNV